MLEILEIIKFLSVERLDFAEIKILGPVLPVLKVVAKLSPLGQGRAWHLASSLTAFLMI